MIDKLGKAVKEHPEIKQVAIGGGVSANSGVRNAVDEFCRRRHLKAFIPKRAFTTDNAAMVAIAGYFKYLDKNIAASTSRRLHASKFKKGGNYAGFHHSHRR